MGLKQAVQEWANRPGTQRPVFWLLRRFCPVLRLGRVAIVSRYEDVVEVLTDGERFPIAPINDATMQATTGRFILGMDDSAEYRHDYAALKAVIRPDDLPRIRAIVGRTTRARLEVLKAGGQMDLVQDIFRPVLATFVDEYFGVSGPSERAFLDWMRSIFHGIFLNLANDTKVHHAAVLASRDFDSLLHELMRSRRFFNNPARLDSPDVLSRLMALQQDPSKGLDDAGIRHNLAGVIAGAIDTTSKTLAHIVDHLLSHPDRLASARAAAVSNNDSELLAILIEALRFNPHNPIIVRSVAGGTSIGSTDGRAHKLPAGTTVYASTLSAMFDDARWEEPGEFRPGRPADQYLHFGWGLHQCFGRHIVPVLLTSILGPILSSANLRRGGPLKYSGPFPESLLVRIDPRWVNWSELALSNRCLIPRNASKPPSVGRRSQSWVG